MTNIKTLAEILADMGEPVSADSSDHQTTSSHNNTAQTTSHKTTPHKTNPQTNSNFTTKHLPSAKRKSKAVIKQSDTPKASIDGVLNDSHQNILDKQTLNTLQNVAIEPIYQHDKATARLRWLAFYYLSNKELSQKQLRQKLIDKDCDAGMVDALLDEFAVKGYQSDERTAFMLIREGIRRGRGKRHIAQSLKTAGLYLPFSLDELIQMADINSLSDGTILENASPDDSSKESVNWLKLAVEARCKKYGNSLPCDQKQKARQLRFLQYRGFEMGVCFDALKYTLDDMDELDFV